LLSSLLEIKNDLSAEVQTLTKRMVHIDEQISQIFNFLSPLHLSISNHPSPITNTAQPSEIPSESSLLQPMTTRTSSDTNTTDLKTSPVVEPPSFPDANSSLSTITDVQDVSRTNDQSLTTPPTRQISDYDPTLLIVPPPPSIYNRSANSSVVSLGISTIPRGSASNKIVPTSALPSSASAHQSSNTSFRPMSNTRYNPGRSPKLKIRSHHTRSAIKHQQSSEQSTIIELDSPTQQDASNKNVPLLSTTSSSSSTKSGSSHVFRRFMPGSSNTEKTTMSSSTLLYPPTSDDDRPTSPTSSGNDDDDHRPLTSSSSRRHHHTPL
jgi:hypothetical protein